MYGLPMLLASNFPYVSVSTCSTRPKPRNSLSAPSKKAVVIAIRTREFGLTPGVDDFNFRDTVNGKWQTRHPRFASLFVLQIKPRRRLVVYCRNCAEIVANFDKQVRFLAAHQIDVFHRPACIVGHWRRPNQACSPVAQQV